LTAIEVDHLVKRFGGFTAVEDISFDVPAGQVAASRSDHTGPGPPPAPGR
jgi:ABC-type Na+ transport system ATPase subunit NatA